MLTGTLGDGHVDLAWNAVAGAVKYRVRRSIPPGAAGQIGSGTFTTYRSLGQNGTEYEFQVVAVDASGGVAKSNKIRLTPVAPSQAGLVGYAKLAEIEGGGKTVTVTIDTGP